MVLCSSPMFLYECLCRGIGSRQRGGRHTVQWVRSLHTPQQTHDLFQRKCWKLNFMRGGVIYCSVSELVFSLIAAICVPFPVTLFGFFSPSEWIVLSSGVRPLVIGFCVVHKISVFFVYFTGILFLEFCCASWHNTTFFRFPSINICN